MAATPPPVEDTHLCFYDPNFLQTQGLTADNVLVYFSMSQFYDRTCVNEVLKMQSQFAAIDIAHHLTTTVGVHYALESSAEGLFVIAKRMFDGTATRTLRVYYCLNGYVFCAPSAAAVAEHRLAALLWHLDSALDAYERLRPTGWLGGAPVPAARGGARDVVEALYDFKKWRESTTAGA